MKFWQLVSGFRSERAVLEAVLADPEWAEFRGWYTRFDDHVARQDRTILDAVVPDTLVHSVASRSSQTFCLAPDGTLRTAQHDSSGEIMSALAVVQRFGGAAIEDVHEYGSARVTG